ncbi:ead/Ea22-like family protein [Salmonella enterica subsp. enterica serovar Hillingdon]|nr:ead/Ea22-like family protein [Salmonella enterica subsp. enterica serovar Hillingdon]EDR0865876.1 ead/Ea22-like family protein [Salmonella enterica subsp. enterica serovar Hillingdon]EDR6329482.1 ead/Ea22-like family protein [Salmonella enterica subsp. enterica serovar Hillingdon]
MSNIDKQALLKIAESVDREEWDVLDNGDDEYQVIVSGSLERGATYRSYRPVANEIPEQEIAAFIAAANPATVLALLDENIQLQRGKDAMEAVALALRDDMRDAREKLEAAERRIAELDKRLIEYAGIATREAHRVAELEARTVNLPAACADDEYFIDGVFQALRYERDVERAISAAGIKVKGE